MELKGKSSTASKDQCRIEGKRLLNMKEAAIYLSLSPRTLYNGVAPGSKQPFPVKAKRIGKSVRFDIRDLDKFIDSLDVQSNG